jgi:hypothetical protein
MRKAGATLSVGLAMVLVCGCAMIGGGPSDEELIASTMADYKAGLEEGDIDKFLATHSDEYDNPEMGDKEALAEFVGGAIEQGFLDDLEVGIEDAKTVIEGETATVSPVELEGSFGGMSMEITLKKEGDAWRVISSEQY